MEPNCSVGSTFGIMCAALIRLKLNQLKLQNVLRMHSYFV